MRILVTGAAGFLGRSVVRRGIDSGHTIHAMIRRNLEKPFEVANPSRLNIVQSELDDIKSISEVLSRVDCVIHLAASLGSGSDEARISTLSGTSNLIDAMKDVGVEKLILVSSIAVYDYLSLPINSTLDENSSIETNFKKRDNYCRTKLEQERIARSVTNGSRIRVTILRPGPIVGRGRLWTYRLGPILTPRLQILIGGAALLPLTHVENCSDALVKAATSEHPDGEAFNIVDDDPLTQRQYCELLRRYGAVDFFVLRIPRFLLVGVAQLIDTLGHLIPGSHIITRSLSPESVASRTKPLLYSNQKLKSILGWHPSFSIENAVSEAIRCPGQL